MVHIWTTVRSSLYSANFDDENLWRIEHVRNFDEMIVTCIGKERLEGKTLTNHSPFVKFVRFFHRQVCAIRCLPSVVYKLDHMIFCILKLLSWNLIRTQITKMKLLYTKERKRTKKVIFHLLKHLMCVRRWNT